MINKKHIEKAEIFHDLHKARDILVLPNAWDCASARVFEQAGFPAIGTTSAGIAVSLGFTEPEKISLDEMLKVIERIVKAVSIPVTADIEAGYASTANGVAETIKRVIATGAVGVNLEDTPGVNGADIQTLEIQIERINAARHAAHELNFPLLINARTDLFLFKIGDEQSRFDQVVMRANAYLKAGADCIFIPGVGDPVIIETLVRAVHGPINILANPNVPSIPGLQRLGVARVSLGSGPMRATMALIRNMATELLQNGTYTTFTDQTIPYAEVNQFFK